MWMPREFSSRFPSKKPWRAWRRWLGGRVPWDEKTMSKGTRAPPPRVTGVHSVSAWGIGRARRASSLQRRTARRADWGWTQNPWVLAKWFAPLS